MLNHPNLLAVYDVGTHDGELPYVVSELLEGHTLRERLEGGALPVRRAVDYGVQIAKGLAAAHDKGIVHRDLKPDNLFVTNDGRVKVLDFGLAKLTRPPEQVRGEEVDHRSDIFSFGAVLYEMLSGERAFRRDSAVETMNAILKEDPTELSGASIPPGLARIVERCLEKRAGDRFHSTHDVALALETVSDDSRPAWVQDRRSGAAVAPRRANRSAKAVAATSGAVALLAAVAYLSDLGPPSGRQTSPAIHDPEAERLVRQSRDELNKLTLESVQKALGYARQATELYPDYAPGYVAMAHAYTGLADATERPDKEAYAAVKAAATKALEIDETLAEAHTSLARAMVFLDWDWVGARPEFERAIELDPRSAAAHGTYGAYLTWMGSAEDGIRHLERATELDPLTPHRHMTLGWGATTTTGSSTEPSGACDGR